MAVDSDINKNLVLNMTCSDIYSTFMWNYQATINNFIGEILSQCRRFGILLKNFLMWWMIYMYILSAAVSIGDIKGPDSISHFQFLFNLLLVWFPSICTFSNNKMKKKQKTFNCINRKISALTMSIFTPPTK